LAHPFFKDFNGSNCGVPEKADQEMEMDEFTDNHIEIAKLFVPYNH